MSVCIVCLSYEYNLVKDKDDRVWTVPGCLEPIAIGHRTWVPILPLAMSIDTVDSLRGVDPVGTICDHPIPSRVTIDHTLSLIWLALLRLRRGGFRRWQVIRPRSPFWSGRGRSRRPGTGLDSQGDKIGVAGRMGGFLFFKPELLPRNDSGNDELTHSGRMTASIFLAMNLHTLGHVSSRQFCRVSNTDSLMVLSVTLATFWISLAETGFSNKTQVKYKAPPAMDTGFFPSI